MKNELRWPAGIRPDAQGLVPVVAQDAETREVLLLAFMNAQAFTMTLAERRLVLWSRSRQALWRKGEQSGNQLDLVELRVNCELNSVLALVHLRGIAACHEGYRSCYFRALNPNNPDELIEVSERKFDPAAVYAGRDSGVAAERPSDLESACRKLFGAYWRMRETQEIDGSKTSRLLHAANLSETAQVAMERATEELEELRGVIAGTHVHSSPRADAILEASQVGYWVNVCAVATGLTYEQWNPHRAWAGWPDGSAPTLLSLASTLSQAGALCAVAGVTALEVVLADLTSLRERYPELVNE